MKVLASALPVSRCVRSASAPVGCLSLLVLLAGCQSGTDPDKDGVPNSVDCADHDPTVLGSVLGYIDADGDGFGAGEPGNYCPNEVPVVEDGGDCDDADADTFPGAPEDCAAVDRDCDGAVDESATDPGLWYLDADGDGFGREQSPEITCQAPESYVDNDLDCADDDPAVHPDAEDVCDDVDNNCDGDVDESGDSWYRDRDGDGYGDAELIVVSCDVPSGYVRQAGDCDDTDAAFHPNAPEDDCADPADYNCDGSTGFVDADGDGFAACDECDDQDADVNPDAREVCDGVDNDCSGEVDDDAVDAPPWYRDTDRDGYGDAARSTYACEAPSAWYVADDSDCDDGDAAVNPGAIEVCNGIDDDCDVLIDDNDSDLDGATQTTWHQDSDGDGYGDAAYSWVSCDAPSGFVANSADCDDNDAEVNPGATEICNDTDDDCDGTTDGVTHFSADFNSGTPSDITLNGSASLLSYSWGGYVELTPRSSSLAGSALITTPLSSSSWSVSFDFGIGAGGADGLGLVMLSGTNSSQVGSTGGGMGAGGLVGYGMMFDTFDESQWAYADDLRLVNTYTMSDTGTSYRDTSVTFADGATHTAEIGFGPDGSFSQITVVIDGQWVYWKRLATPTWPVTLGFTAGTGSLYAQHNIDNVVVSCP